MTSLDNAQSNRVLLERWARRFARRFPACLVNEDDFLQIGHLGIVKLVQHADEPDDRFIIRGRVAAWYDIVDAARRFGLIRDLQSYNVDLDEILPFVFFTDFVNELLDLQRFFLGLSPRDCTVLRSLAQGETLLEIGLRLHLTEGRISQIRTTLGREYRAMCLPPEP